MDRFRDHLGDFLARSLDEVLETPTGETLCDSCKQIDFESVGKLPLDGKHKWGALFERLTIDLQFRILRKPGNLATCLFCRKIRECFYTWMDQEDRFLLDDVEPRGESRCQVDIRIRGGFLGQMVVRFKVATLVKDSCNQLQDWYFSQEFQRCESENPPEVEELIARSPPEFGTPKRMFYGRIRPKHAKTQLFLEWFKKCTGNGRCEGIRSSRTKASVGNRPSTVNLSSFRLVDVDKMRVIERSFGEDIKCESYAALSYVWGEKSTSNDARNWSSNNSHRFQEDKFGYDFRELCEKDLPATISDAIQVTKMLGLKYLWVDSICIIQDDDDDKQKYISHMDSIYGMASVTIIAATGVNSHAGLRGLRPGSRNLDPRPFTIEGVTLLESLRPRSRIPHLSFGVDECIWNERGWTFQEKIFSNRRLIFTEELVYWECKCGMWCEESMLENGVGQSLDVDPVSEDDEIMHLVSSREDDECNRSDSAREDVESNRSDSSREDDESNRSDSSREDDESNCSDSSREDVESNRFDSSREDDEGQLSDSSSDEFFDEIFASLELDISAKFEEAEDGIFAKFEEISAELDDVADGISAKFEEISAELEDSEDGISAKFEEISADLDELKVEISADLEELQVEISEMVPVVGVKVKSFLEDDKYMLLRDSVLGMVARMLPNSFVAKYESMLPGTLLRSHFIRPFQKDMFTVFYPSLVREYTKRRLTYPDDGLNAFRGVLTALESDTGYSFIWALPTGFLSNALAWYFQTGSTPKHRRRESEEASTSSDEAHVYSSFPSWSWVGWEGAITWDGKGRHRYSTFYKFRKESNVAFRSDDDLEVDWGAFISFYCYVEGTLKKLEPGDTWFPAKDGPSYLNHKGSFKQHVALEDVFEKEIAALPNILFFWTSSVDMQVKQQDWALHQKGEDLSMRMIWFQRPSLCDGQDKVFECIAIGTKKLVCKGEMDLVEGEFELVGGGDGGAECAITTRGAIIEYLSVLLLSPPDRYGVQCREGLVLIELEQWHALKRREWKLIRLG